ncbi:intradiol ring-cleavage dioxygenase [Methylobacterium nodulans]|uniref:Intradiol ring-cleavage dioxygenase n=1 Tax=Methylobacterium nodulans (strain LMG 21967 / CNCM I-2342 / ORS 2060) TaxID=460265 RepID=B8IE09_METNO|nr:intradiol ring-cleavage dioxygenase [Methylobacterium nodulans]ACL57555.1 intradiol ring-cleavage dioxygenase [Methylobacterium nodulans ORS 2060]
MTMTRRSLLTSLATVPVLSLGPPPALAQGKRLALTPECSGVAHRTIANPEGPYFRPSSPLKRDLAADVGRGDRIFLGGFVRDEACRPVPGALIELWHADDDGRYDNVGFKLRGHQFSNEHGMWWFATIVPAAYWTRTRHYHFKVQRPNDRVLTTQLYFPGEQQNQRDREFDARLLMRITKFEDQPLGRFDFVI